MMERGEVKVTKFIRFDTKNDQWILHKEPYTTIEVETQEDFIAINNAIMKHNPMKVEGKYVDVKCPLCGAWLGSSFHKQQPYCHKCGQKLEWDNRDERV